MTIKNILSIVLGFITFPSVCYMALVIAVYVFSLMGFVENDIMQHVDRAWHLEMFLRLFIINLFTIPVLNRLTRTTDKDTF